MLSQQEILEQVKTGVQELIPDAKVYLFGSRARGDWHEESDWDILVLTKKKYPDTVKQQIQQKLFPLSLSINSLFQFVLATEEEWENAPELYILYKGVGDDLKAL